MRVGGGCQHFKEEEIIATNVIPRQPNLIFIGGISQSDIDSIYQVINQVRASLSEVEFLLATGTFSTVDPCNPETIATARYSGSGTYGQSLKSQAKSQDYAYLDMTTPWAEYIRSSGIHPHCFYRDKVYANEYREQILPKILMAFWTAT